MSTKRTPAEQAMDARRRERPGDHGEAMDAIDWTLDHCPDGGVEAYTFLKCWREGNLDEWPDYYFWLREAGR